MDNNLTDYVQDVDNGNKSNQAMEDCLGNPVIVRRILEHVSSKELLQISLVNKLWKYEARSVVRNRGDLVVNLKSGSSCQAVAAFISDLHKMSSIPASGIIIDVDNERHFCGRERTTLVRIRDVNLEKLSLSLKSLSVRMVGPWLDLMDCSAILLATRVLQQFSAVLQEMSLEISEDHEDFMDKVVQDCYFPRLEILKVKTWRLSNEDSKNFFKELLSRAPNLKKLHTNWDINSVLQLLQGTSVGFVYTTLVRAPFDEIPENKISTIWLDHLELKYTCREFNLERFNRIAPVLLQASCSKTLRSLDIDVVFAMPLMCYGICLENVKNLWMIMDYANLERNEPRILNIVKNFDFTRILPSLEQVDIVSNNNFYNVLPGQMNTWIERANAILPGPLLNRATRIKKLVLYKRNPTFTATQFFADMFPNIRKLKMYARALRPFPFDATRNWSDLKELEVVFTDLPTTGNLDSLFCGIFPEEAAELRLKDDEFLKSVHIVPVMPAITCCLRSLRTLSLCHWDYGNVQFSNDGTYLFSKVTALVAFSRLPGLAVSLTITAFKVPPAMDHLKPYVSVSSHLFEN